MPFTEESVSSSQYQSLHTYDNYEQQICYPGGEVGGSGNGAPPFLSHHQSMYEQRVEPFGKVYDFGNMKKGKGKNHILGGADKLRSIHAMLDH